MSGKAIDGLLIFDLVFSVGIGLVTHSIGWALVSLVVFPILFVTIL